MKVLIILDHDIKLLWRKVSFHTDMSLSGIKLSKSQTKATLNVFFVNVIRCATMKLWAGYFIYFKFTPVLF